MVLEWRRGEDAGFDLDLLLNMASIEAVALEKEQLNVARTAFRRFGKGRHPASLNFGDCASYAWQNGLVSRFYLRGWISRLLTCCGSGSSKVSWGVRHRSCIRTMPDSLSEFENSRTVVQAQIAQLGDIRSGTITKTVCKKCHRLALLSSSTRDLNTHTQVTLASWPVLFRL